MTAHLSAGLKQYLDDNTAFATVATLGADGQPHLTVVWIDYEGDDLLYSTTVSRKQYQNLERDPRVTVLVLPPDSPYTYAEVRGTATITPDPERALPDRLSLKYTGKTYLEFNPASADDSERVVVRVTPSRVTGYL